LAALQIKLKNLISLMAITKISTYFEICIYIYNLALSFHLPSSRLSFLTYEELAFISKTLRTSCTISREELNPLIRSVLFFKKKNIWKIISNLCKIIIHTDIYSLTVSVIWDGPLLDFSFVILAICWKHYVWLYQKQSFI